MPIVRHTRKILGYGKTENKNIKKTMKTKNDMINAW